MATFNKNRYHRFNSKSYYKRKQEVEKLISRVYETQVAIKQALGGKANIDYYNEFIAPIIAPFDLTLGSAKPLLNKYVEAKSALKKIQAQLNRANTINNLEFAEGTRRFTLAQKTKLDVYVYRMKQAEIQVWYDSAGNYSDAMENRNATKSTYHHLIEGLGLSDRVINAYVSQELGIPIEV